MTFATMDTMIAATHELTLNIGGMPILVRTDSADFALMLADRYGEFAESDGPRPEMELEIELLDESGLGGRDTGLGVRDSESDLPTSDSGIWTTDAEPLTPDPESLIPDPYDVELSVRLEQGIWVMERGDFRAEWNPQSHRGRVRQTANPYSIDGVLRILHSLILAREGGFLVHAASAVHHGQAYLFAGVSGAGKTTISRLAPADVTLLTDEISYIREMGNGTRDSGNGTRDSGDEGGSSDSRFKIQDSESPIPSPQLLAPAFQAYGTPFAGELARIGVKARAPLARLFLLQQGSENRIEPVSEGQAVRELMRHILFFAHDPELVELIFQTVCDFVKRVPVSRLVFTKDASVWELIG